MAMQPTKAGLFARVAQAARFVILGDGPGTSAGSQEWMGPSQPLAPIAPPDVKGRQWDYPVGQNLRYIPRSNELYGFAKLRMLAETCNVLRIVIERQKDLIEAFDWSIKPREEQPGRRPAEAKYRTQVDAITAFLQSPDRDLDWGQWLRALLEDLFVIDAVAIYRRPTADGSQLWGLERISGDTLTRLIDASGRKPQPPDPAYQQILKGVPAGDFTSDELIYYPKNPRTNRLYGQSPVQMIVDTIETQIYRLRSQKAFFDQGNLTDGMFTGPSEWSIDQIKSWQSYWDDHFAGNVESRRQGIWVPNGTKFEPIKQPPLKDEFDEWLARVICFAFSTSPMPFVKSMNRGNQESQQEVAEEGGIATYMAYVKRLMDRIIREDFGHPELEFCWSDDREFDPHTAAQIDDIRLKNGSRTLNEVRDRNGDDPYPGEIGDIPMVITASGPVSIVQAFAPPPEPSATGPEGAGGAAPPVSGDLGGAAAKQERDAGAPVAEPQKGQAALAKAERPSVPVDSPQMRAARKLVKAAIAPVLADLRADVIGQVEREMLKLGKADEPEPDDIAKQIAAALSLIGLDAIPEAIEGSIADVAEAAGNLTLLQVGVTDTKQLTGQIAQRALIFARDRSAELVGKRWTADGQLIDNPNPKWAIDESTREMVRREITEALGENESVPAIADRIAAIKTKLGDAYAFSDKRAEVIAETEISRANVQGALEGAREAVENGVALQKVWLLGQEPCDECLTNADQGPIDLGEDFESGDDGPPAHPKCVCSLSWSVDENVEKAAPRRALVCEAV